MLRKNLLLTILSIILLSFIVQAQTQEILFKDTVGNSQSKVFTVDVVPELDSVELAVYWRGAIDADSLDVKFILDKTLRYKGANVAVAYTGLTNTTYSKILTTDLDSAITRYDSLVTSIPRSAFGTYSQIQFTLISAASGNDKTDTGQKAVAIVSKYYHYKP